MKEYYLVQYQYKFESWWQTVGIQGGKEFATLEEAQSSINELLTANLQHRKYTKARIIKVTKEILAEQTLP